MFRNAFEPASFEAGRLRASLLMLATAVVLFAAGGNAARAHAFYPWECCHDQDCWPAGKGEREPAPTLEGNGWRLFDGTLIPLDQTRSSPDGRFHVCRRGGAKDGAVITPHGKPACLWVPQGGT